MSRNLNKVVMTLAIAGGLGLGLLLAGCKGVEQPGEHQARGDLASVTSRYRPQGARRALPPFTTHATLDDFLTYALLNEPQIEAAYFDWAAAVENITVGRSLPDPELTFQMDIADVITSVMPGFLQQFPGPGKLRLQAEVASAESEARYFDFENAVLQTAFAVKRGYYQLWFLDEKIRIDREMLHLLSDLEQSARAQNSVGKGTLQDVYRAQIEQDQLATEITNLEDSRTPMLAEFKAALGMTNGQPDPPPPARWEATIVDLSPEQLLATAFARNPRLKAMEAGVRQAQASLELAVKSKTPDFSLGLMADAKLAPVLYRPLAGVTLPLWRDKIAAEIAGAQAAQRAAEVRLTAGQIALGVDFAEKSYDYRQIVRSLTLLEQQLIPKAQQSLEIARSGYLSGQIDFFNLMDTERTLLQFRLAEVEARTEREVTLAEMSLLIAGVPPANAPLILPSGNSTPVTINHVNSK
jgi:outer membrane protein TolC